MRRDPESAAAFAQRAAEFENSRELVNEIPPEMEAMFKDAIEMVERLDSLDDPEETDAEIARFAGRHKMDEGEALSLLEKIRGEEDREEKEDNPKEKLEACRKVSALISDLCSTISADKMREKLDVFSAENEIDVSTIAEIINENENNIQLILRRLSEMQQALIETMEQLEEKLTVEEDSDLFDDFDEGGKKKPTATKKKSKKVEISTPESRREKRRTEFITQFVTAFRRLRAENISDIFSFQKRLRGMSVDINAGTNNSTQKTLYDFVIQYGDRNRGMKDRLRDLFNLFQDKREDLDPYMFARQVLLYEGSGSYTSFVNDDPPGTSGRQVYVK